MVENPKNDYVLPWKESPYPIKGAGGGRLGFEEPYIVRSLVVSRERLTAAGITVAQEIAANVKDLLGLQIGNTMVDLGTGPGLIARHLVPYLGTTGRLYCLDASLGMLQHAQGVLLGTGVRLIHGDIHTVDKLIPEQVDAAILSGNIHLLTNKEMAMNAIRRTLKPGGKLAIVTHAFFYRNGVAPNLYTSIINEARELQPTLQVDGLRLPMLTEQELSDVARLAQKCHFQVKVQENVTWAPDNDTVFGTIPEKTIETRLRILRPDMTENDIYTTAQLVVGDTNVGRQAQIYILCVSHP